MAKTGFVKGGVDLKLDQQLSQRAGQADRTNSESQLRVAQNLGSVRPLQNLLQGSATNDAAGPRSQCMWHSDS